MSARATIGTHQRLSMGDYDVEVTRKRVRNINMRVRRDGSVAVSAPARLPLAEVERFVRERASWIDKHRRQVLAAAAARTWEAGSTLAVWGVAHTLRVAYDADAHGERAERAHGEVVLHLRPKQDAAEMTSGTDERRARLFDDLLARELRGRLEVLLPSCEARVGRQAKTIRLRRMVSRWGSCNVVSGAITLNLELAERPEMCLEAVLCHELCHLHERGHNARFYAHLDRAFPAWREARALLRTSAPHR